MESASQDILAAIMLPLDYEQLNNVAASRALLGDVRAVMESNYFWNQKLQHDFGISASLSRNNKALYFDIWLLSDKEVKRNLLTEAIRYRRADLVALLVKYTEVIITDLELALEVHSKSIYKILCQHYRISPEFKFHLQYKYPRHIRLINKVP